MAKSTWLLLFTIAVWVNFLLVGCNTKNDTPGPLTTVHGTLTDYNTAAPIAGVKLIVLQSYSTNTILDLLASGNAYRSYDTITTAANGTYKYTFTPLGTGDFTLYQSDLMGYINSSNNSPITLGIDNNINIVLQKLINLKLHLINSPNHTSGYYHTYVKGCCYISNFEYGDINISPNKLDSVALVKIPEKSAITIMSYFIYTSSTSPLITYPTYTFNSGLNDTTITIINP